MNKLIEKFPNQLLESLEIGRKSDIKKHSSDIHNVVLIGMGTSGVAGGFVSDFVKSTILVPIIICKSYTAPNFIDRHTLVIITSYSGNTRESIDAYTMIVDSGAKIVFVTSGGKLMELGVKNNIDCIKLPVLATSRAGLGHSIVAQLSILTSLALIGDEFLKAIKTSTDIIRFNIDEILDISKRTARRIEDKMIISYSSDLLKSVGLRFKQQLNENAKKPSWTGVIPEMNHNEIAGWTAKTHNMAVLIFRSKNDLQANVKRIEISKKIIEESCDTVLYIWAKGKTLVEQSMYLIHIGDWISFFLAGKSKNGSLEVKAIDYLNSNLS